MISSLSAGTLTFAVSRAQLEANTCVDSKMSVTSARPADLIPRPMKLIVRHKRQKMAGFRACEEPSVIAGYGQEFGRKESRPLAQRGCASER
jgi:hypothetical protein